jgi:hypothetical protein
MKIQWENKQGDKFYSAKKEPRFTTHYGRKLTAKKETVEGIVFLGPTHQFESPSGDDDFETWLAGHRFLDIGVKAQILEERDSE